mmetsp:Transcript_11720/g.38788  ORF Transcript_11720/g.38788 Transcript_11720/m.38788 type:complete len:237 (-) Transcript_11720:619-1329(-)
MRTLTRVRWPVAALRGLSRKCSSQSSIVPRMGTPRNIHGTPQSCQNCMSSSIRSGTAVSIVTCSKWSHNRPPCANQKPRGPFTAWGSPPSCSHKLWCRRCTPAQYRGSPCPLRQWHSAIKFLKARLGTKAECEKSRCEPRAMPEYMHSQAAMTPHGLISACAPGPVKRHHAAISTAAGKTTNWARKSTLFSSALAVRSSTSSAADQNGAVVGSRTSGSMSKKNLQGLAVVVVPAAV